MITKHTLLTLLFALTLPMGVTACDALGGGFGGGGFDDDDDDDDDDECECDDDDGDDDDEEGEGPGATGDTGGCECAEAGEQDPIPDMPEEPAAP